jgi:hypothetical protein
MERQLNDGLIEEFVDFLLPILKPYEATIYLYLQPQCQNYNEEVY